MDGDRMSSTAGFYKYESQTLHYGPNYVYDENYALVKEHIESYLAGDVFPVDGWYWFDSREEALAYFGIVEE
jgi:hypothetical protein